MRKLSYLLGLLIFTGVIFSCSKDDDDDTTAPPDDPTLYPPEMSFKTGGDFKSSDFTIEPSKHFTVGVEASTTSDVNLVSFKIGRYQFGALVLEAFDTTFNSPDFDFEGSFAALPTEAVEEWRFTVLDADSNYINKSIIVTTALEDPGFVRYNGIVMGSNNSSIENAIDFTNSTLYLADSVTNDTLKQMVIDFMYFNDPVYGHTFMSTSFDSIYSIGVYPDVEFWTFTTKTMFAEPIQPASVFEQINSLFALSAATNGPGMDDKYLYEYYSELMPSPGYGFEVNDMIALNGVGIRGLIKIREINEGSSPGESTVKFDMIVNTQD